MLRVNVLVVTVNRGWGLRSGTNFQLSPPAVCIQTSPRWTLRWFWHLFMFSWWERFKFCSDAQVTIAVQLLKLALLILIKFIFCYNNWFSCFIHYNIFKVLMKGWRKVIVQVISPDGFSMYTVFINSVQMLYSIVLHMAVNIRWLLSLRPGWGQIMH